MKQKITVIVLLCVLVGAIVGASFLYESLKDTTPGAQLATPGGSGTDTDSGSEDDTVSSEGDQSEDNHDHTNEGGDSGEHGNLVKAYDFTVYDADGNKVKLSDFFGKPIVLNFWASWCGPCKSEMPTFDEVYKEYKDDIHFVIVNLTDGHQETVESATNYVESSGYSFPIYYDKDSDGAETYGVYSIPVTYFIDKDGYLTAYGNFPFDKATLLEGISMIYNP